MYHKFLLLLAVFVVLGTASIVIAQTETVIMPGDAALDGLLDTGPTTTPESETTSTTSYPNLPKKLPKTWAEY